MCDEAAAARIRAVRAAASSRRDVNLVAECDKALPPVREVLETTRAPKLEDTAAPRPVRRKG